MGGVAWSLPRSVVVAAADRSWYKGHRYPPEIIAHCVWLVHQFPLSFREVEELMFNAASWSVTKPSGSGARSSGRSTPTGCAGAGPGLATNGRLDEVVIEDQRHDPLPVARGSTSTAVCSTSWCSHAEKRVGRHKVLPPTAQGTTVRAAGARHRQARQLRARPPRGGVEHRQSKYLNNRAENCASTDPATRAGDETVHLRPGMHNFIPVSVQPASRHISVRVGSACRPPDGGTRWPTASPPSGTRSPQVSATAA